VIASGATLEDLANVGEFVGGIADLNRFRSLLIQDAALGRIYLQGLEDPSGLTPEE
jgi:hypothetical protein